MVPRKKRERYRREARKMAQVLNQPLDLESWDQIWAFLDEHEGQYKPPTFLYVIADLQNRLVKIGRSISPGARLRSLKTGNGSELRLWAYCEHKSPFTEREIHGRLADFRISGEWFRLTPAVQTVINDVREAAQGRPNGSSS